MSKTITALIAATLGAFVLGTAAVPLRAGEIVRLPAPIKATLDAEYPGWKYAAVNQQVQKEFLRTQVGHPPSLVWGDFDHDGKRDYAVQVALTQPGHEEQFVSAFMDRDGSFEEVILESRGLDPSVYLWVIKKMVSTDGAAAQMRDVLVVKGSELGETLYTYQNGGFRELREEQAYPPPDSAP